MLARSTRFALLIRSLPLIVVIVMASTVGAAEVVLQRDGETVTVTVDGQLFTRYVPQSGSKPILWPVMAEGQIPVTRGYPMVEAAEGEVSDHPHHRSLWFTHGDVNGVDYWLEPSAESRGRRGLGKVVHREIVTTTPGERPSMVTRSEWVNAIDELQLTEYRTMTFGADKRRRWIDLDIQLFATGEEMIKFGDTKEGTLGIRVAHWMKVDSGGRIVNNLGVTDADAWGKSASWVDYHGDYEGTRLGIAILNHPSSFRFPTYWHVRTYGLFAANVFGLHNFKNSVEEDGSFELELGENIMFCYRILIHPGDEQAGRIPESFIEYAKVDKKQKSWEDYRELADRELADPLGE